MRNLHNLKMSGEKQRLKELGALFRDLRLTRGWTLEETEDHGWHDWKYLQKIEGGRNITVLTLFKLCDLYGVRAEKFISALESSFKR